MKQFFLALILTALTFVGCSSDDEINVTKDIVPVQVWNDETYDLLDSLKHIPDAGKLSFIETNLPHLTPALCRHIETGFPRTKIDSIVYTFGSGRARGVRDRNGDRHNGVFEDELIANVWLSGKVEPIIVFVRCLNGTFEIKGGKRLGPVSAEFVIRKDEGLCHHLDFATAIWLADKFNLPLFKGKTFNSKYRITPEAARRINTDDKQVTVLVYPGDRFKLFGDDARYIRAKRG